jgi:hypothetical protein
MTCLFGLVFAGAAGAYGLFCILSGSARVIGFSPVTGLGLIEFRAREAVACGGVYLALAAFLHVYFFWASRPNYARVAYSATIVALLAVAAAVVRLFSLLIA